MPPYKHTATRLITGTGTRSRHLLVFFVLLSVFVALTEGVSIAFLITAMRILIEENWRHHVEKVPHFLAEFLRQHLANPDRNAWAAVCLFSAVVLQIARALLALACVSLSSLLRTRADHAIRVLAYETFLTAPLCRAQTLHSAEMNRCLVNAPSSVSTIIQNLGLGCVSFSLILALSVGLLCASPKSALIIFPVFAIVLIIPKIFHRLLKTKILERSRRQKELIHAVHESLQGLETLHIFGAQQTVLKKIRKLAVQAKRADFFYSVLSDSCLPLTETGVILGLATFVFIAGLVTHAPSRMALTNTVIILGLIHRLGSELIKFAGCWTRIHSNWEPVQRLSQYLNDLIGDNKGSANQKLPTKIQKMEKEIHLNQIDFAYGADQALILNGLSLKFKMGTTVMLTGPSGIGKTTLAKILIGHLQPISGEISIDGESYSSLNSDAWRSQACLVTHQAFLFNDTVMNNILLAKPEARFEEVVRACKLSEAHDFILDLDNGYDSVVQEKGSSLSSGQKQRINLARAILRNPEILILDEPTAAIDAETENTILKSLFADRKNKTTIFITHNPPSEVSFDHVIRLPREIDFMAGCVRRKGTSDEWLQEIKTEVMLLGQ